MAFEDEFLNCCNSPLLIAEKTLFVEHYRPLRLCRCSNCGAYWSSWVAEGITDINKYIVWYVHVTQEEAVEFIEHDRITNMDGKECYIIKKGVVEKTIVPPF